MIRLNCFFTPKDGKYDEALKAAITLTEKSQSHDGCVFYDVLESKTKDKLFAIVETWESAESLKKHSETPEFAECVAVIQDCGELKIEQFEF